MARTCIFCDSPLAGTRAEEHAIPRWLMEFLGLTDGKIYLAVAQSKDDAILKDRTHAAGNFVEGRVCEGCNNGWMNDLEKQTKELLKPLIQGTTNLLSLSDDERATLAKWATKTGYVISHASPLKKTPPPSHMRYMKDHAGDVPPRVEVFGQQVLWTSDFNQIQRNHWPHIAAGPPREDPAPPDGTYKIAFQFRSLMLLVAYWAEPRSMPMISASIHIPLWPLKLHITYHQQLPPLDMKNSMAALDRFCSTLGIGDLDAFIPL
jgi:hypothetical protein